MDLSLEIDIFDLEMMVKRGLKKIYFEIHRAQSCCCPVQKHLPRKAELALQVSSISKGARLILKKGTTFHHHFKVKKGNFKTQDFSPLIERVLASVYSISKNKQFPLKTLCTNLLDK